MITDQYLNNKCSSCLIEKMKSILAIFALNCISSTLGLADWTYQDQGAWGDTCLNGQMQSPIEIPIGNDKTSMDRFTFKGYDKTPSKSKLSNLGWTAKLMVEASIMPMLSGGGLSGDYQFHQAIFHWGSQNNQGSEHRIEGDFYPVEVQLIHYKSTFSSYASALSSGNAVAVAILSIMMEIQTDDNAKLAKLTNGFDNVRAKDMSSNIGTFPLVDLLPRNTDSFFRFKGSLTYPDCNEVVIWTVFKDTISISVGQLNKFRSLYVNTEGTGVTLSNNMRPTKPLNGRDLVEVDTSTKFFGSTACIVSIANINILFFSFIFYCLFN